MIATLFRRVLTPNSILRAAGPKPGLLENSRRPRSGCPRAANLLGPFVRRALAAPPWVLAGTTALTSHARGMDPQAQLVLMLRNFAVRPSAFRASDPASVAAARREMAFAAQLMPPVASRAVSVVGGALETATGTRPIRRYHPADPQTSRGAPALVYFHGGGFALGDLDSHDAVCRWLADAAGCVIVSVDYRLAPEHPFPAAPDDAIAAFRAVARDAVGFGIDPRRIAVGGDSAGGNLAALVALATRKDDVRPALQVLVYPHTDLTRASPSVARFSKGFFLEQTMLDAFATAYAPDPAVQRDPRASPAFADVTGTPPAIVVTAGFDPLVDEGCAYAARLAAAGVPTTPLHYPTLFHGFASTAGGITAAATAMREVAAAIRGALGTPSI